MTTAAPSEAIHWLHINKEVEISAPVHVAFEALLAELGPENEMVGGVPFPMKLEAWPGGRWYRDLGNNAGHLWGHVQVIKPPTLLEICGPLFMSFPVASHVQYRLTEEGPITRLALHHRAMGPIPAEHREGVNEGWQFILERIRTIALRMNQRS